MRRFSSSVPGAWFILQTSSWVQCPSFLLPGSVVNSVCEHLMGVVHPLINVVSCLLVVVGLRLLILPASYDQFGLHCCGMRITHV